MVQPYIAGTPPTISDRDANIIIYMTLGFVLLLTLGFALFKRSDLEAMTKYDKDAYIAARGTQGTISLTLSYFVSGCGAWVIFAVPQAAVVGGWFALTSYALSAVFPLLLFGVIAPTMREQLPQGFTINEYILGRFGTVNAIYFGIVALFYMMLYLTAELAAASTLCTTLSLIKTQKDTWWKNENVFVPAAISPIVGTSAITLFYTIAGGLPASLLTDRVQGVGIFILTLIICMSAYAQAGIGDQASWDKVVGSGVHPIYDPTDGGNALAVGISLIVGVTCANMVHAGYWQRIWAAESNRAVVVATYYSSVLTAIVMILVGITGWIAYSQFVILITPNSPPGDLSWLSVPWLITTFMEQSWAVIAIVFGISMIASTCDTLQSGMTALLWPVAHRLCPGLGDGVKLVLIVVAMAILNVPAIILALSGQSILQLFLLADLLAAGVVAPLFLGFWKFTHPAGAFCGAVGGLGTTLIVYGIGEAYGEGFGVLLEQGGIFRRVATYAFCITPVVSAMITIGVSKVFFPGYQFAGYPKAEGSATSTGDVPVTVATA
jgi:Na+/proline symporter